MELHGYLDKCGARIRNRHAKNACDRSSASTKWAIRVMCRARDVRGAHRSSFLLLILRRSGARYASAAKSGYRVGALPAVRIQPGLLQSSEAFGRPLTIASR